MFASEKGDDDQRLMACGAAGFAQDHQARRHAKCPRDGGLGSGHLLLQRRMAGGASSVGAGWVSISLRDTATEAVEVLIPLRPVRRDHHSAYARDHARPSTTS